MSDSIDRQAAIDEIDEWIKAFRENGHKESAADACLIQVGIIQLPSAQPEIIRCKDCKHYYYADNRIQQEQRYTCDLYGDRWNPDDYCSYAERKTDD